MFAQETDSVSRGLQSKVLPLVLDFREEQHDHPVFRGKSFKRGG